MGIKRILKGCIGAFIIFLLSVSAILSASAEGYSEYKIDEIGVSLSLPSTMKVVTRSTSSGDEALKQHNISIDDFVEYGVYLQAYSTDDTQAFSVTMNQDNNSKEVNNYSQLDEAQLAEIKESYNSSPTCEGCSMDKYNDVIYFDTIISNTDDNGNTVHMTQADTVVDGKYYHFILQSNDGEIGEEDKSLMTSILERVKFENNIEKEADSTVVTFVVIVGTILAVIIIAVVIFMTIKKRRRENALRAIDDQLYAGDKRERLKREEARRNRNTATGAERPDAFFDGVDGLESSENIDKLERELIRDAHRQAAQYTTQDAYDDTEEYGKEQNDYGEFLNKRQRGKRDSHSKKSKERRNSSRKF